MGIIIYLFNQLCGFQLAIMLTIYYSISLKFPIIAEGNYKIIILVIIGLIWFINLILLHFEAVFNIFTSIYILFFPFIFIGKLIFSGIKKLYRSPYINKKLKMFKLKRTE